MNQKEKKLVNLHRTFFWQSEKIIKSNKWDELDSLFKKLPADIMNVNNKVSMGLHYIDPNIRNLEGLTQENIHEKGAFAVVRRVEPSNFAKSVKVTALSSREIEILAKVALGKSSQEIGDELSISKLTVDTHRKNIMNKLETKRFVDLIRFAEAFDLV